MARIPAEELERLKAEVSVEQLVSAAGVDLKAAGKDLLGRCPFHEDREASLVVTPGKNLWHCFSCQIGGGPIDCVSHSDLFCYARRIASRRLLSHRLGWVRQYPQGL